LLVKRVFFLLNLSLTTENLVHNNLITRRKNEGIEEKREKIKERN